MRNVLIGILLAGAMASPALAQDSGEGRWRHDPQQRDRAEGRQARDERAPQAPAPMSQPPIVRQPVVQQQEQQVRGPRFGGGNFAREPQGPQFVREQRRVDVQQGEDGPWRRGRFEGRANPAPPGDAPQQSYGYRGPLQVDQNRTGGWTRSYGYRGDAADPRVHNGWYGQRGGVTQPQYHNGTRYSGGTWDRDWRSDRRFDWRRYRDSHRSVFRLGVYIDPFGYGYRPYSIGYRLQPVYFGQQYWIDPALYELPYPPPGTQWVRYWNDALLVDIYTGQVVDVIQGFFW